MWSKWEILDWVKMLGLLVFDRRLDQSNTLALPTKLTPKKKVLLEKLIFLGLAKKFTPFCWTRRFVTAFLTAFHLSLSWARSTQSNNPPPQIKVYFFNIHPNSILPSMPRSSKLCISFSLPHQNTTRNFYFAHTCHIPNPSHSPWFYHPNNTGLLEMIVGIFTTCHLVHQIQPHVISFYGVTSRIRFMFLLFPQVSRNWRYESEQPLKPSPLACYKQFGTNSIIVLMFVESQRVHI